MRMPSSSIYGFITLFAMTIFPKLLPMRRGGAICRYSCFAKQVQRSLHNELASRFRAIIEIGIGVGRAERYDSLSINIVMYIGR